MKIIILILCLFLFVQCTTSQLKPQAATDVGVWQGKVLITNKKIDSHKWASLTWVSDSAQEKMRIDIHAIMNIPLATFVKGSDGAHLWIFQENKHYYSKDSQKLFKYLTKISLNPDIFYSLLGRPAAPNSRRRCKDSTEIYKCYSKRERARMTVDYSDKNKRIITFERGSRALRLRLSRTKVQVDNVSFKPLSLSQFKTIKI